MKILAISILAKLIDRDAKPSWYRAEYASGEIEWHDRKKLTMRWQDPIDEEVADTHEDAVDNNINNTEHDDNGDDLLEEEEDEQSLTKTERGSRQATASTIINADYKPRFAYGCPYTDLFDKHSMFDFQESNCPLVGLNPERFKKSVYTVKNGVSIASMKVFAVNLVPKINSWQYEQIKIAKLPR